MLRPTYRGTHSRLRAVSTSVGVAGAVLAATVALTAPGAATAAGRRAPTPGGERATAVTVHSDQVMSSPFMGFGAQVDPYEWFDVSQADWQRTFHRLNYLHPSVMRVMLRAWWYTKGYDNAGRPIVDWRDPRMVKLYKLLDWAKAHHVTVMIGEWDDPAGTNDRPADNPLAPYDIQETDPRWTHLIGAFLHRILEVRHYTNVDYYNIINEPNGDWSNNADQNSWLTAVHNLHAELVRRGLTHRIKILGPDESGADTWVKDSVDKISNLVALYDAHRYAQVDTVESGALEQQMWPYRQYISQQDTPRKPFLMSEAGIIDGRVGDTQTHRYDFIYGAWMADYAVQVMRAGMAGASAWDADDAMHIGGGYGSEDLKGWGFWNTLGGTAGYPADDTKLRPWFDSWSELSRMFPRGSRVLQVPASGIHGVRVTAAKVPTRSRHGYHLSLAVVNDSDTAHRVRLVVPEAEQSTTFDRYDYFSDDRPTDAQGFPVAARRLRHASLARGVVVDLPSRGMVTLSSLHAGRAVRLAEGNRTRRDDLGSLDGTVAHSAGWTVDDTNPWYFAGDTSRLKRTDGSTQTLTYRQRHLRDVALTVFSDGDAGTVSAWVSRHGRHWTSLPLTTTGQAPTDAGWRGTTYLPAGRVPRGTSYLKVAVGGAQPDYSPQLGTVTLRYRAPR